VRAQRREKRLAVRQDGERHGDGLEATRGLLSDSSILSCTIRMVELCLGGGEGQRQINNATRGANAR
jgi:hypothetical protein